MRHGKRKPGHGSPGKGTFREAWRDPLQPRGKEGGTGDSSPDHPHPRPLHGKKDRFRAARWTPEFRPRQFKKHPKHPLPPISLESVSAERRLAELTRPESPASVRVPGGYYPMSSDGPLCPFLRQPDMLWEVIYGEKVRQRALLTLAIQFHQIPPSVETTLEQDRLLALRMLDSPAGRKWVSDRESPAMLVSLHNAIYRRFLQADRSPLDDPWYEVTQLLRAAESRDTSSSRAALDLERWRAVIREALKFGDRALRPATLYACAFAMMQPEHAAEILNPMAELAPDPCAGWLLGTAAPSAERRPPSVQAVQSAPAKRMESSAVAPVVVKASRESVVPVEATPAPSRQSGAEAAVVSGAVVGSAGAIDPSSVSPGVGGGPDRQSASAPPEADHLLDEWNRVSESLRSIPSPPTFVFLESLLNRIGYVLDAREKEIVRVLDVAGKCRLENPDHAGSAELEPFALRRQAEEQADPESLRVWTRGVVAKVEALRDQNVGRVRELLQEVLGPIQEISRAEYLTAEIRSRYAGLAERLLQSPPRGVPPERLKVWQELGRRLVDLEKGLVRMAEALPKDPARYDDNMRAFVQVGESMREWVMDHWLELKSAERAARLFDMLALPKFSWQPSLHKMREEGFLKKG